MLVADPLAPLLSALRHLLAWWQTEQMDGVVKLVPQQQFAVWFCPVTAVL